MRIEPATPSDWPAIADIYREGIRTGHATFEKESDTPTVEKWFAGKIPGSIFKAIAENGSLLGWAALSSVSDRCAYVGVAEVSVYVSVPAHGQRVGTYLLNHLVKYSEAAGIWTLQAGIFPENSVSLQLHYKAGFRTVGYREKIGKMDGVWRDVLLLERRSPNL